MIKKKVLEIIAWSLAGTVLVGGLCYYNFIDKAIVNDVEQGNVCPDFTVQTYTTENGLFEVGGADFTLSDHLGKVVIVNFWADYCGPCIAEIPDFNRYQVDHADSVVVITLNGQTNHTIQSVATWLNTDERSAEWSSYDMLFGRYEKDNDVYVKLGFTSYALPGTIIIDQQGYIVHSQDGKMHYEELDRYVAPLLDSGEETEQVNP